MAAPAISVIIPSYNGAHKLGNILDALAEQDFTAFEVLVVLDGSTDESEELLEKRTGDPFPLRIVEQENKGRAGARNRGAAEAKADILLFFDDDMRPQPGVVNAHYRFHNQIADAGLVGGQRTDPQKVQNPIMAYKLEAEKNWEGNTHAGTDPKDFERVPDHIVKLTAAHFSISASAFNLLAGFEEELTDAEDFDLHIRMKEIGLELYSAPQLTAWHDDFITCESYIRRQRQYRKAHEKLAELRKERYYPYSPYKNFRPGFLKKLLYSPFARKWLVRAIDRPAGWFTALPKSLQYKLIERVVYGFALYFPHRSYA